MTVVVDVGVVEPLLDEVKIGTIKEPVPEVEATDGDPIVLSVVAEVGKVCDDAEGHENMLDGIVDDTVTVLLGNEVVPVALLKEKLVGVLVPLVDELGIVLGVVLSVAGIDGVPITMTDVLVNVVVDPPGIVLVNVVKIVDVNMTKGLDFVNADDGLIELGELLGTIDDIPPDIVIVDNTVVVAHDVVVSVGRGISCVKVVITVLVRVVVSPPETILVRVIILVDVMIDGEVGGVLDNNGGDEAGPGDIVGPVVDRPDGKFGSVDVTPSEEVAGTDERVGVTGSELVAKVLNKLGGAMLFIHCVVPLITEK